MSRPEVVRSLRPAILLVALAILGGASQRTYAQDATILGCVADEHGRVVSGATVLIVGTLHGSATDGDGCFSFVRVAPGSYRIRVTHADHFSVEVSLVARPGETERLDVVLRRRVTDAGRPRGSHEASSPALHFDWQTGREDEPLAQPLTVPIGPYSGGARFTAGAFAPAVLATYGAAFSTSRPEPPGVDTADGVADDTADDGRPYIGGGATSNTGMAWISAGASAAAGRSTYRFDIMSAGAGAYEDGEGAIVGARFGGAGFSASAHRLGVRTAVDIALDARQHDAYRDPGSRLRYEGGTGGRLEVVARHARERSSVRFMAGVEHREQRLVATSFPGDDTFAWQGSRNAALGRLAVDARHRVTDVASIGAVLSAGVRHSEGEPVRPGRSGLLPFPGVRDRSAGLAARVEFDTGRLRATATAGFERIRSVLRAPAEERRVDTITMPIFEFGARYNGRVSRFDLSVVHDESVGLAEERYANGAFLRAGQTEVLALGSFAGARRRTTRGAARLTVDHGTWSGYASIRTDWYHRIAAVVPSTDAFAPWRIVSHRGWAGAVDGGAIYEPASVIRSGVGFRFLRGVDRSVDEPIAGLPSSTFGVFTRVQFPDGYPYLQWTTVWRPERERVSGTFAERSSPSSIVSDLEAGTRFGRMIITAGVWNVGDRIVRDHPDPALPSGRLIFAPGRSFFGSARYVLE